MRLKEFDVFSLDSVLFGQLQRIDNPANRLHKIGVITLYQSINRHISYRFTEYGHMLAQHGLFHSVQKRGAAGCNIATLQHQSLAQQAQTRKFQIIGLQVIFQIKHVKIVEITGILQHADFFIYKVAVFRAVGIIKHQLLRLIIKNSGAFQSAIHFQFGGHRRTAEHNVNSAGVERRNDFRLFNIYHLDFICAAQGGQSKCLTKIGVYSVPTVIFFISIRFGLQIGAATHFSAFLNRLNQRFVARFRRNTGRTFRINIIISQRVTVFADWRNHRPMRIAEVFSQFVTHGLCLRIMAKQTGKNYR